MRLLSRSVMEIVVQKLQTKTEMAKTGCDVVGRCYTCTLAVIVMELLKRPRNVLPHVKNKNIKPTKQCLAYTQCTHTPSEALKGTNALIWQQACFAPPCFLHVPLNALFCRCFCTPSVHLVILHEISAGITESSTKEGFPATNISGLAAARMELELSLTLLPYFYISFCSCHRCWFLWLVCLALDSVWKLRRGQGQQNASDEVGAEYVW